MVDGAAGGQAGLAVEAVRAESVLEAVSYTNLRAHETVLDLVCRLPLEKKKLNLTTNSTLQVLPRTPITSHTYEIPTHTISTIT